MPEASLDLLREAISKRAGAVLSLPKNGTLCHFKTRFLAEEHDAFLIESVPTEPTLIDQVIADSANIGIAFRIGPNKVIFTSSLCRPSDGSPTSGLLVRFPTQVHLVQRRSSYRVSVGENSDVEVRVWRIADHAILRDRPSAVLEVGAALVDLSVGGLGLNLQTTGEPPLTVDQRLRVLLHFGDDEALLDARARHVHDLPDKTQRVGAQFKKLENDLEGRQTLSKLSAIVAHLQRQEILRARMKEELEQLKMAATSKS
jgi:c-di-GMP-binding flagellar brake protein YcgR